ncbi:endonuclease [Aureococcus anophagefferens]|nr:endonuclease [Aureococcus anophagefferens]
MDALDAMLESGGPSPAASLSKEKMKEIASKSSWQPPGAKADKKAAKPSAGWTKAELNALKRAVRTSTARSTRTSEAAALPEDSTFEDRLAALGIEARAARRAAPRLHLDARRRRGPARARARRRGRASASRRAAPKPKSTWTPGDAGGGGAAGLDPLVPVGRRRFYEGEVVVGGGDDAKPKPKPKPKKKAGGAWGDARRRGPTSPHRRAARAGRRLPLAAAGAVRAGGARTPTTSVSFSERVITNSADGAVSVFALDVDGDGAVNVLSASYNADTVAWYENDASQSFTERVITDSFDGAYSVFAIGDGDGGVDALSASYSHDTVAWYENDGSQSFTERVITTLADGAFSVFAIDSFTERVITNAEDGAHSVFAIDVARRVARGARAAARPAMAPAVADGVLARDEELQRIISGATDAAAVKNLKLLRTQHRSAWCWVPARRLFVANVTAILEERLHLAAHLDGELSAISGATPEETVVLREAKLFEYERIARLGATGAIYFARLRAEDDEAPETPTRGAYVTGRAAYAALVAGLAYYVVARRSSAAAAARLWVRDLVSAFVIYYGIIAVVEVYFFAFLLPSLLEEHFTKFEDPTRGGSPSRRLPASATFFVAAWHEELHGTRVGRYCLGDAVDDGVFDGSSRAMARIYADEAWRPSPAVRVSIALLGGLTVLPFSLQEVAFEEAFTVAPVRRVDEADDYDAHSWTGGARGPREAAARARIAGGLGGALRRARPAAEDARPSERARARAGAGRAASAAKPPSVELATKRVVHDYDVGDPDADISVAVNPLALGRRAPQTAAI